MKNTVIDVNSNFHHIIGDNLFDRDDNRFKEYRKKWKEWPENFQIGEFPLFIDIEVTSLCNLKCPFCATTFKGNEIKKGFVSADVVKRIIDEGADNNLYGVKFNIRGEPLLHHRICEFVKYGKDKGLIDIYFNTNGMLLTDDMARGLIDAGLDRLSVSVEGYSKDMYESYRIGGNYETVLNNVENLQSLKVKSGVSHPKLRVQTVMFNEMKDDFSEYSAFWSKIADEVGYLDYKEMKQKKEGEVYSWACPQIWQRMAIWWDGTILPCNHDDDGLIALGNINDISIKEGWQSDKLNRIRDMHKSGIAHKIDACDGCYLRDSEIMKQQAREIR